MKNAALHFLLGLAALFALAPMFWLICAAFKSGPDLFSSAFLPWRHLDRLSIGNFRAILRTLPFARWMINSLFVSASYTAAVVMLSALGGFALAKYRFAGQRVAMGLMLVTMLLPPQVLLPGSYELIYRLGWIDSFAAIIVPGAASVFGIFLFRQAMLGVPDELLQAGRLDGCSELRLWWDVALPAVRPMIGAFSLLSFLSSWNALLWPQIVLLDDGKFTLPIAMNNLLGLPQYQQNYGLLMAATVLSIVPVAILFFSLQRELVSGLATAAVKG